MSAIWGYEASTLTRTVDVQVARLRNKLEINPSQPELHRSWTRFINLWVREEFLSPEQCDWYFLVIGGNPRRF